MVSQVALVRYSAILPREPSKFKLVSLKFSEMEQLYRTYGMLQKFHLLGYPKLKYPPSTIAMPQILSQIPTKSSILF